MPRDLPVGNGNLLVAFDDHYQIRDLYWPHVGQANHTMGHLPFAPESGWTVISADLESRRVRVYRADIFANAERIERSIT
jgi:GH15 family glucan-1,4-alpha-glucosidase